MPSGDAATPGSRTDGPAALEARLRAVAEERGIRVRLGAGALDEAAERLRAWLPAGTWVVAVDATTRRLAGDRLARELGAGGNGVHVYEVQPRHPGQPPVAGTAEADALEAELERRGAVAAVAVGSGTVNDLVKVACHRRGLRAGVVATAASMNGYVSSGAALLVDGVKTTQSCPPPVALVGDTALIAAAPGAMTGAGLGDLRSRATSCADWYLGHRLVGSAYRPEALALVDLADALSAGVAPGLARGDVDAVAGLTAGLLVSGLAMDMAGTSAPSSGGEHVVSHFIDMRHYAHGTPHHLHGAQVGVATIAVSRFYERFLELAPASIDPEARAAARPDWPALAARLEGHFDALWPAVAPMARQAHDTVAAATPLRALVDGWDELTAGLRPALVPSLDLRDELAAAGAPVTFADLGVSADLGREALLLGHHIRPRFTILDLADELGCLHDWVDDAMSLVA